jgi:two-component system, sensor histidine kinase and response regulator
MLERLRHPLTAYVVALGGPAVTFLARWMLMPVLGNAVPQMTFFPAVMIAAYIGGFWPGIAATFFSAIIANYFLAEHTFAFHISNTNDVAALVLFVFVGTTISALCESLHRIRRQMVARERRQSEEALREAEERFQRLVENIHEVFWMSDVRGERMLYVSPGYEQIYGRTCQSLYEHPESRIENIHMDDRARVIEHTRQREDGVFINLEFRVVRPDGSIRWVRNRVFPIKGENGQLSRLAGLMEDITDRKRAEEKLRQSEERFRGTFENAAVGIANVDFEGHWLSANQRLCDILGYTREELLQKSFQDITYADDLPVSLDELMSFAQGERPSYSLQKRYVRKDGSLIWAEIFGSLQRDTAGKPAYTIAMIQEISERKRLEGDLRESEHRWRGITEALPQLVWTARSDGYVDYQSTQFGEYFGLPEDKMLGSQWLELLHPDDRERTRLAWQAAIEQESDYDLEQRLRRFDGVYRWFKTRGVRIRDNEGNTLKWFGTCTDVTDNKKAEEALRESEHRWRSLTETLPQLVWTAMPDGVCDYFSTQWTQYTGVPTSELLGWEWMDTLHPDDREPTRRFWLDSVAGRHDYDVEYRVRRFDGEYRWFKTRGVPIRDTEGNTFKWFGTCTDITDGKLAAEELRLAKEAAESANRAKDEFLANVSHEIRTPMNAIMGLTTLVLGTQLNDGQRQSLTTVKSAANSLLGIINDLLDFSKIEAGKLELNLGEFSLRAALDDTLRALAIRAHQKGLELVSNVQPEVPDRLIGDAGRLRQVLLNLVGNAIKFTQRGEVVVQVAVSDEPSLRDEVHLLFTVRDTGIGIPREKHAVIFRAFEQEDSSTTRRYGGTGLGLTISAQLVALMGGKISVESEPGRGSIFSITARFKRSSNRGAPVVPASHDILENLRVLIVDDNATNRHILEEWLHNWRMRPAAVGDGAAALNALRSAAEKGTPFSLVLLDGRMPDTDGVTLAGQIRQHVDSSTTRIILLPSDDSTFSIARSREMRISAHLLKPVQQSELLETICQVMTRTTQDATSGAPTTSTSNADQTVSAFAVSLRILVAEDNEFNVILLKQLLGQRGHSAHFANDGREALALATESDFDLLLLDIHMPEMDGFQVAHAIREQERGTGRRLPIIAFTARSGKPERERCLVAGMDDFLSKPVQADALWAAIDRIVALRLAESATNLDLLDPRAILRACGGEAAILTTICQAFQTSVPNQMSRVRAALRDKDAPRLREAAHLLCGTLSAFSTVAGGAASNLEDEAARGQIDDCEHPVERLESMCSALVEQTRNLSIEQLTP